MVRSRPLAQMRVLLQGPDCRVWYLGERIRGWEAGGRARRVPVAPPRGMFHTHLLRGEALAAAYQGIDADELCDKSKRRYHEFARAQLLQRVGPVDPLFQAVAGGSSSQVSPLLQSIFTAFPLVFCWTVLFTIVSHILGTCSSPGPC